MDSVEKYLQTFESLRRRKRWTTDLTVLRFTALSLAAADPDSSAERLENVADEIRRRSRWWSELTSSIRYAVAAMILRAGLEPRGVLDEIERVRAGFRKRSLRRGGIREVLAALALVVRARGGPVPASYLHRLTEIVERWRRDHWWLTGPGDYPLAALHAAGSEDVVSLTRTIESIYQALHARGFSRGNALQLASHILGLRGRDRDRAVDRFCSIGDGLRARGERPRSGRYDEIALLALTSIEPQEVVRGAIDVLERLRAVRYRPSREIGFSIATGLMLSQDAYSRADLADARDVSMIAAAQAILEAQQAAAVACCAAVST